MDENRLRGNSDVGSSSVQVLISPIGESESVQDISEVEDVQETTKRQEEEEEEEEGGGEETVPIVSALDVTNVQLVDSSMILMEGQVSNCMAETVVILEAEQITTENDNEQSLEEVNDCRIEIMAENDIRVDQNDENVVPVDESVASCSNSANFGEPYDPTSVYVRSEETEEQRNQDAVAEAEENVPDVDVQLHGDGSSSPDANNRFIEVREVDGSGEAVVSYSAEEEDQNRVEQRDQESQVVPDSSAVVSSSSEQRFVTENLHETMEVVTDADLTVSLEMQMVPTFSEDNDNGGNSNNDEMIIVRTENEFECSNLDNQNGHDDGLAQLNEVPDSGNVVPILEPVVDDGQSSVASFSGMELATEGQQALDVELQQSNEVPVDTRASGNVVSAMDNGQFAIISFSGTDGDGEQALVPVLTETITHGEVENTDRPIPSGDSGNVVPILEPEVDDGQSSAPTFSGAELITGGQQIHEVELQQSNEVLIDTGDSDNVVPILEQLVDDGQLSVATFSGTELNTDGQQIHTLTIPLSNEVLNSGNVVPILEPSVDDGQSSITSFSATELTTDSQRRHDGERQQSNEVPIDTKDSQNVVSVVEPVVDDGQLSVTSFSGTELTTDGEQAIVPVLTDAITSEEVENNVQAAMATEPEVTVPSSNEMMTSYLVRDHSGNVEVVQSSDDHTYEVCVTIPNDPTTENNCNSESFSINDQEVQEIPIELSDWSNIGGEQSLVAITEDGRTIPLTVVRHGPNGELVYQTEENDVQLSSEILQQLANSHFLDGSVVDANNIGDGSTRVIEMLQSEDGTVILESSDGVASSQSQQIIYRDTMMIAEGEQQAILPDVIEDVTDVIHIPENAYISGQPFEVQFIDVTKEVSIVDEAVAPPRPPPPSRSLLKEQLRAPQRKRPIAPIRSSRTTKPIYARSTTSNTRAIETATSTKVARVNIPIRNDVQTQELTTQDDDDSIIQLSNTTPSVISPENMQELIQILQSLPLSARGQTIQIILQSSATTTPRTNTDTQIESDIEAQAQKSASCHPVSPKPIVRIGDNNIVPFIKMVPSRSRSKTTTDIAIQVNSQFIDDEQQTAINEEVAVNEPPVAGDVVDETVAVVSNELESAIVKAVPTTSEDDRSKAIVEAIMESSRKKRPYRKRNSKKIVTLQEQWVVDPKPGVSYYAVVDYLSEHDQDGFSSASEMKRPEAPSSDFMEDHLELQNFEVDNNKTRSILESTIDSSVFVSPFRRGRNHRTFHTAGVSQNTSIDLPNAFDQSSVTLTERTFEQAQIEEENLAVGPMPEVIQRRKRRIGRMRTKTDDGLNHKCGYCPFDSSEKVIVVEHCIREHSDEPIKTLSLLPRTVGRNCPYCHQNFDHSEFFTHMRCAHNEVHPYKCGYCDFMGRDRNQIRHHIQKKHRLPIKVINLMDTTKKQQSTNEATGGRKRIMALSDGEDSVYEYLTDEEELEENDSDNTSARRGLICPECKKTFKTLKYLKTHIKIHQAHRYQCGYCDFISIMLHQVLRHCQKKHGDVDPKILTKELEPEKNPIVSRDIDDIVKKVFSLNTRLPRDPDGCKWMRKWFCPHCDYTCQFGASYRRHLRMHANILPYKCNYCSFKGREKYYVRRHITRMHTNLPVIVVENTPENCAGDTSSDEDFQEKGLRRKRRRRMKDQLHTVVPVEEIDPDEFQEQYQMQPIRERMQIGRFASEDSQNVPPTSAKSPQEEARRKRAAFVSRLHEDNLWPRENISDYIQEKQGDKIVCKVCGHKTLAKNFSKHAQKHFKVKPFKCGYCNYISVQKNKIRAHNKMKHSNLPFKMEECHLASLAPQDFMDLIGGEPSEDQTASANVPQFVCPLCQSNVEYDERILSEHFYSHFEYYPYQCSECEHQNVSEEKVVEHGTSHGGTFAVYETGQTKPEGLEETIRQFLKEGQELVQQRLHELMDTSTVQSSADETTEEPCVETDKSPTHLFLCPICDRQMNLHAVTVRRHLYGHYDYKPFKCGHCSFLAVSKAKIKKHTVTHGSVPQKIEITDKLMPEDLAKMLREIHGQIKQSPHATSTEERRSEKLSFDTDPTSTEGKIWHEMLSKGECPWCGTPLGSSFNKLRDHLLGHFNSKPHRCGHCSEEFARRNEVNQHIIKKHPNQELKISELDEETIRRGLRLYINGKKQSDEAVEGTTESSVKDTKELREKVENSLKEQNDKIPEENNGNATEDATSDNKSTEKEKLESPTTNVYESDSDADIMTVEGVLLTRTFRSETEASSDEDQGRDSNNESDDDEDVDNEEDFLVGDVAFGFVLDIMNILKKTSFTNVKEESDSGKHKTKFTCDQCQRHFNKQQGLQAHITKVHSRPREESGPLFVCGYCEFSSNDENETQTHIEEKHSNKPIVFKKEPTFRRRGIRRRGGARGRKRQSLVQQSTVAKRVRTNSSATKEAKEVLEVQEEEEEENEEEEEEETLENITKMVQRSSPSREVAEQSAASDITDKPSTACREFVDKEKCEQPVHNEDTLINEESSLLLTENMVTEEESTAEATTYEEPSLETDREDLHVLTPLVPNKAEDGCMESQENVEKCDENLPKILHILQLRPAMDDIDGNT